MVISPRFVLYLTIIAAALAGCAVTKIDVDVYKGPLANHEKVQLEQLAVMAIGARPILMRLRDRLEETKLQEAISFRRQESLRSVLGERYGTCIQEDEDTEKKEMEKAEKKRPVGFESDEARRVNAILCLYENRPPEHIGWLERRARKALWKYRKAWGNFQGENRDWKAFKDAMYSGLIPESRGSTPGSLPDGHPLEAICSETKEKCYSAIDKLIEAYGQPWARSGPKRSAAKSIWEAHKGIFKLGLWTDPNHRLHSLMESFAGEHRGSNWAYRFLSNDKLVQAHADLLFEAGSDKKKEFVHTVTSIAKSFRSARAALRDLLQINLDILDAFGQPSGSESAQDLAQRAVIAQSIVHLIGRINFRVIIKSVEAKRDWFSQRLQEFANHAKDDSKVLSKSKENMPVFKAFLISELTRKPLETAAALREADLLFPHPSLPLPTKAYENDDNDDLKRYAIAERREFGLARVIPQDAISGENFMKRAEKLQEESGAAATGLERGRLNDGLESMIEDYLEQDDIFKMYDERNASVETHRLRDALVRFAQKMLFVADYDNLMPRGDPKTLLGYAKDYTIDLLTQPLFDDEKTIREYTQVLQAVGNSILNQADELQARETHGLSLKDSARRARYGASRILDQTPQQTVAAVIDKFEAERIDASNSLEVAEGDKKTTLTARVNALKTTVAAINSLKTDIIAKALAANLPNDPSATFLLLKTTVAERLAMAEEEESEPSGAAKEGKENLVARWQTVWKELDGMNTPASAETTGQNDFEGDKTSREVLDRLIAVLEYERIEAIKRGGREGRRANNIADALRVAYKSRARLTFIRPASSYLRSSYPTASLQSDPGLTWRNELQRHSLKSIPIFGGKITRYLDKSDISPEVRSQIDRQFWQNINSIRVSGAGRTNYVMVQDDIGNWYVKNYSANPEDIIKSAKALGQFALGGQLGTDLVNRPAPGTGSAPARQPTALEAVFAKHQKEYDRVTEETFKAVKAALDNLPSEVQKAWHEDPGAEKVRTEAAAQLPGAKVHLTEAVTELNKDDSNKPEQVAQRPARIVAALRAMDRYRDQLEASIRKNVPEEPSNEATGTTEERKTAINAVITNLNAVVKAKIERFLKRREDTVNTYENAIVFTGEVAGQAPVPTGETAAP